MGKFHLRVDHGRKKALCWWEPWGEVGPINGTIGSGFFRKSEAKMASQRIKLAPGLTVAVYPIGTMPMEAGNDLLLAVVTIKLTIEVNNGT